MREKRKWLAHVGWGSLNVLVGFGVFIFVWAASVAVDSGDWQPLRVTLLLAGPVVVAASALTGYFTRSSSILQAMLADSPFLLAAVFCFTGVFEGVFRPFLFWSLPAILVFALSLASSQLGTAIARRVYETKTA